MADRFLKRFEKLENLPADELLNQGLKISKRFELLEIGDKRIEIAITDRINQQEQSSSEKKFFVICPYCGADNISNAEECSLCRHALQSKLGKNYQEKNGLLAKCVSCGTMNHSERPNCWLCGRLLPGAAQKGPGIPSSGTNEIILNMNGKEYRSSDKDLPGDIRLLMDQIRARGYSKELIDEWLKNKEILNQRETEEKRWRLEDLQQQYSLRRTQFIIGIVLAAIIVLLQILFNSH